MDARAELAKLIEGWITEHLATSTNPGASGDVAELIAGKLFEVDIEIEESWRSQMTMGAGKDYVVVLKIAHPLGGVGIDRSQSDEVN